MVRYQIKFLEDLNNFRMPSCSVVAGKKIKRIFTIFDFDGAGMSTFDLAIINHYRNAGALTSDYYPETMAQAFFINMPFMLRSISGLAKSFVDEKTRKSMVFCGSDYLP